MFSTSAIPDAPEDNYKPTNQPTAQLQTDSNLATAVPSQPNPTLVALRQNAVP